MLTEEIFDALQPGEVIRTVTTKLHNITGKNEELLFVAVKGQSGIDWAIYFHFPHYGVEHIKRVGDKVHSKEEILSLCPCTEGVLKKYRR